MNFKPAFVCNQFSASARRQAIRWAFFCFEFWGLSSSNAWAQNLTPSSQQLVRQAAATTDLNQKVNLLESAVRLSPQYVEARLELAKTLIQAQQFRRAIFQLDTVLSKNIRNAEAWFYKGRAHAEVIELSAALNAFNRAISLQKNRPEFCIE